MTDIQIRPSASLSSLPKELLTQIALHLPNRSSAISFALVARHFASPAEHRIWRDLDLWLHPNHGEYPQPQPYPRSAHNPHLAWAKARAKEAELRHREGLREKVEQILLAGDRRRMGLVQEIKVIPRPRALHSIVQLLGFVSPNLKSLDILAPDKHLFQADWLPDVYDILDVRMLGTELNFKSLTHLYLEKGSVRYHEFVLHLLTCSPNLISLEADLTSIDDHPSWLDSPLPDFNQSLNETQLQYLHLALDDVDPDYMDENTAISILEQSPKLKQVSLRYIGVSDLDESIIVSLSVLEHLSDLHLSYSPNVFCSHLDEETPFSSLRRLTLTGEGKLSVAHLKLFETLPALPALEILFIDCPEGTDYKPYLSTNFPEPPSAYRMISKFGENLLNAPKLRIIHPARKLVKKGAELFEYLDELESKATHPGIIRSFRHGNDELLHARFFTRYIESPSPSDQSSTSGGSRSKLTSVAYVTDDGLERSRRYTRAQEDSWIDYTDYKSRRVPLEIIQKMRLAEGVGLGQWEGRQIEVGDAGWKVLTDWEEGEERKSVPGPISATEEKDETPA